jgi:hypothetical protein
MTTRTEGWPGVLAAAATATRAATGRAALKRASEGLRLAWATDGVVLSDTADGELWWLRLSEAIAETADDLDLLPGAPGVRLGTGPAPAADLADTPMLRRAVGDLLAAVHDALRGYASQTLSGAEAMAAALAAGSAARAASASAT